MIINILSPGRFHVLDLARELDKEGFDVKFYSYVPSKRAQLFGLRCKCNVSFLWILFPFLALCKLTGYQNWFNNLRRNVQDYITGIFMRKCDVCIAMSGEYVYAIRKAKAQGAIVILERGSKHILEQRRILEQIPSNIGKEPVPNINVKKELEGYKIADYISIAAQHVKESFLLHGIAEEKLFVNPYGVDLSMFKPIQNAKKEYDVIMVGNWSYQKGCDLLASAIRESGLKLLHVGVIGDCPFPYGEMFTHVDCVSQEKLIDFYNKAKIFALPSRQDGFGMVYSQAMACNLPIVGSPDSGAPDLKRMVNIPDCIIIISDYTVASLKESIEEALREQAITHEGLYAGNAINNLTWEAYGKRYADFLRKIF